MHFNSLCKPVETVSILLFNLFLKLMTSIPEGAERPAPLNEDARLFPLSAVGFLPLTACPFSGVATANDCFPL